MSILSRVKGALLPASLHLGACLAVAVLASLPVFGLWYPFPYRELSGGRELFFIIIAVDIICGPLLTLVLFNVAKPRNELLRDLGLVVVIQLVALGYGLLTVWQARPLYLVQEIDRFKVVMANDLNDVALANLPSELQPRVFKGPQVVAIREPKDTQERDKVLFESVDGGRDYAERPEFYLPYEGAAALKSLLRAKPLAVFLQKRPEQQSLAKALAIEKGVDIAQWMYLPVVARQDWVAVLDKQGQIQGFLKGDGF